MKNIGVFVDVSDFYYRIQRKFDGTKLDYGKYLFRIKTWGNVFKALAYGMQQENEASGFIKCLRSHGFETKFKRPKIIRINDREIKQCDWGSQVVIDIVRLIEKLDIIVLGVSNPDYIPLIKWIRDQGKEVLIFGSCIPKSLRDTANNIIEIDEELLQEKDDISS